VELRIGEQAGAGHGATQIVAWRRARLRKAGFTAGLAERLSRECAVDLRALIERSSAAAHRRSRLASWGRSSTRGVRVERHSDCEQSFVVCG
jgi:hypothetical protein